MSAGKHTGGLAFYPTDHWFDHNNCCTLCGKAATGNFGRASHLSKHVNAGELLWQGAQHKRGGSRYAAIALSKAGGAQ